MRVCCDLDDCLNNLMEQTCTVVNTLYGHNISENTFSKYKIDECVNNSIARQIEFQWIHNESLWTALSPPKGAVDALNSINKVCELFIVTATYPENVAWKWRWIQEHYPFIRPDQLVVTYRKDIIKADVIIDDNPQHIVNADCDVRIIMDKPWNRELKQNDVVRAYSMEGVKRIIGGRKW